MNEKDAEWSVLMRAGLTGDQGAYAKLLSKLALALRVSIRRGFLRLGMPTADIEDVVQETLLAIHLKRQTWQSDQPIGPWVYAIARNKLIDAMRKRGRRGVEIDVSDLVDVLAAPAEPDDSLVHDVARHLGQLSPVQAKVVGAVTVDGLSTSEAAAKFAMTDGAVRVALHRGLAALSVIMREEPK